MPSHFESYWYRLVLLMTGTSILVLLNWYVHLPWQPGSLFSKPRINLCISLRHFHTFSGFGHPKQLSETGPGVTWGEKQDAQVELDKALPYLHEAESACNSITKKEPVEPESLTWRSRFLYDFVRTAAAPSIEVEHCQLLSPNMTLTFGSVFSRILQRLRPTTSQWTSSSSPLMAFKSCSPNLWWAWRHPW